MRTLIENGTVIAWIDGKHQVIDAGVVVFTGNEIEFVGECYDGEADTVIDAAGRIVMPGLVNSHLHVTDTLYTKGYIEEVGASQFELPQSFASLYKVLPAVRRATDPDAQVAAALCAFAELARTGSTTVVELGYDFEIGGNGDMAITERVGRAAGQSGLRCYSGPRYRTRYYGDDDQGGVFYQDYPNGGQERFESCVEFCREWNGKFDDRLRTMLAPGQINTCTPQLLKDTRRYADELNVPIQIHAGQSPNEYARVVETEGKSIIEYMLDTGLLGPDLIIGHGQMLSADGDGRSIPEREISALRDSKSTICHLPWVKARGGGVVNSIQKYRDMGIRQCLGTDTYPFDMFNDMRMASVLCKVVENNGLAGLSTDVFHMATVGGADALGRPDLGRIAPGCKADIVFVRNDTPKATPLYDPFKFLVHAGTGDDVDRVIVDGRTIVEGGVVLTVDVALAVRKVNDASKRVWDRLDL
jgi:5-methylthioadenosine/S-adenosylhomocysteine deaminase